MASGPSPRFPCDTVLGEAGLCNAVRLCIPSQIPPQERGIQADAHQERATRTAALTDMEYESPVKKFLERNAVAMEAAVGTALKSTSSVGADDPLLSISMNLLQQAAAAGESTLALLEPALSAAVLATVEAAPEDPLRFLIIHLRAQARTFQLRSFCAPLSSAHMYAETSPFRSKEMRVART